VPHSTYLIKAPPALIGSHSTFDFVNLHTLKAEGIFKRSAMKFKKIHPAEKRRNEKNLIKISENVHNCS